jgi:quercetin dioxygenase-like cupin family protein
MALPTDPVPPPPTVDAAQVVLPGAPLDETINFFTKRLGFRVDAIFPADAPAVAMLSGHGLAIRLQPANDHLGPGALRLLCSDPRALGDGADVLIAPNGTRVELIDVNSPMTLPAPAPSLVVARLADDDSWGVGRAGMYYRDIIPGRQGGRFIGSHIRIPDGGPVPDYVHFHKVRFQMIYCHKGWVRLVYEDQGEPFVLHAGDCVLQPPEIRHRVLESSAGLEVIELGCPADHETLADHDMALPTGKSVPDRSFAGQRFVRHDASSATWRPWRVPGFEYRDIGIGAATDGLAGVRVARPVETDEPAAEPRLPPIVSRPDRTEPGHHVTWTTPAPYASHDAEFVFLFVLSGTTVFEHSADDAGLAAGRHELTEGDTVVVPAGLPHRFVGCSSDLELLDVTLPDVIHLQHMAPT